ncbi:MAG: AMP-binding protein [Proteobacteria bacterium]|nr:AMP-binding protein [Pseudomonadota bacterium]MBU1715876.1 AMP-binding protein [Pseudomonadota bacterium]
MTENNHLPETIVALTERSSTEFTDRPAVSFAFEKPLSYQEWFGKILLLSSALKKSGLKRGDKVGLLAENSPAWGIAYMAIVRAGGIAVPILPDFTEADISHILTDAEVEILFTTKPQLPKIYEIDTHKIRHLITLDNYQEKLPKENSPLLTVTSLNEIMEKAATRKTKPKESLQATKHPHGDDLASIIYTSGTSGHSKAVMLSHRNLCSNVISASSIIEVTPDWTFLSILPLSHTYEFTIGFLLPIISGARIVYTDRPPTPAILEKICRAEKPSILCMVPLVMEKIYKKRVLPGINRSRLLQVCMKLPLTRRLILKKIGRKLLNFFGGNLKLIAIGGAALNPEVEHFFTEAGFPYLTGYGLTEASPLISGGPFGQKNIAITSSGKPIPGVEVKIVNSRSDTGIGEIHARGPNIMRGYHKNPTLTKDTIDHDGWLATGDLGHLDPDGNLFIRGRNKNVIVLTHGENIYPESIEEKINSSIKVVESLVIERNNHLEAMVHLDYDQIDQKTRGYSEQQQLNYINSLLKELQKDINGQLPVYSQISQITERREPFIKTATHKIKRYLYT